MTLYFMWKTLASSSKFFIFQFFSLLQGERVHRWWFDVDHHSWWYCLQAGFQEKLILFTSLILPLTKNWANKWWVEKSYSFIFVFFYCKRCLQPLKINEIFAFDYPIKNLGIQILMVIQNKTSILVVKK